MIYQRKYFYEVYDHETGYIYEDEDASFKFYGYLCEEERHSECAMTAIACACYCHRWDG